MKQLGYGQDYAYDHDAPERFSGQDYFPDGMERQRYYEPDGRGLRGRARRAGGAARPPAGAEAGMNQVSQITVRPEEDGWRFDRWAKAHFPTLAFGQLQKLCRTGQFRLDGKRIEANARIAPGQQVRVPPWATCAPCRPRPRRASPGPRTRP